MALSCEREIWATSLLNRPQGYGYWTHFAVLWKMKEYTNLSSQTNLERCLTVNFGWNLEVIQLSICCLLDIILLLRLLIMMTMTMTMTVLLSSFFSLWGISLPYNSHQLHNDWRRALRSSLPPAWVQLPSPRIRLDFWNGASHFKQLGASNRYGTKRRSALFICWCKWLWDFYEPKKWNIKPSEMQSIIQSNRTSCLFLHQHHKQ